MEAEWDTLEHYITTHVPKGEYNKYMSFRGERRVETGRDGPG